MEQTVFQSNFLSGCQNLIDAAPGLDGTGDGQVAVLLQQKAALDAAVVLLIQAILKVGHRGQDGLNDASAGLGLREAGHDEGSEPGQPGFGFVNIRHGQAKARQSRQGRDEGNKDQDGDARKQEHGNPLLELAELFVNLFQHIHHK